MQINIYFNQKNKRLMKKADSKNDHTIPQEICEQEINRIIDNNNAKTVLLDLKDTNDNNIDIINDNNQKIFDNINITLQYEPDPQLGKLGLLCITGENKEHIIAKFEFYVYKLNDLVYQEMKNKIYNEINQSKRKGFPLTKNQIKGKLQIFNKLLNDKYYYAIILIHDTQSYKNLITVPIIGRCKYYPKTQKFTNDFMTAKINEIMQLLHFEKID